MREGRAVASAVQWAFERGADGGVVAAADGGRGGAARVCASVPGVVA